MQQRLPPSVLVGLATLAGSTFAIGLLLEQVALGFLQRHPYIVNLLSGATGFSTSALVIAVLFNRAVIAHRAEQWQSAAWTAVRGWQREVDAMEALVESPLDQDDEERPYRRHTLHADKLYDLVYQRGGLGLLMGDERPLPKLLPFKEPSGELAFLSHAKTLVDDWLDLLEQAFDVASEPEVAAAAQQLRASVRDPRDG